jgi:hypothetical protein
MPVSAHHESRLRPVLQAFCIVMDAVQCISLCSGFEYHAYANAAMASLSQRLGDPLCDATWAGTPEPAFTQGESNKNELKMRELYHKLMPIMNPQQYAPENELNVNMRNSHQCLMAIASPVHKWNKFTAFGLALVRSLQYYALRSSDEQVALFVNDFNDRFEDSVFRMHTHEMALAAQDCRMLVELSQRRPKSSEVAMQSTMGRIKLRINSVCIAHAQCDVRNSPSRMQSLKEFCVHDRCNRENYWIYVMCHQYFRRDAVRTQLTSSVEVAHGMLMEWCNACIRAMETLAVRNSPIGWRVVVAGVRTLFRMYHSSTRDSGSEDNLQYIHEMLSKKYTSDELKDKKWAFDAYLSYPAPAVQRDFTIVTTATSFEVVKVLRDKSQAGEKCAKHFVFLPHAQQTHVQDPQLLCCAHCEQFVHIKDGAVFHADLILESRNPNNKREQRSNCGRMMCAPCWRQLCDDVQSDADEGSVSDSPPGCPSCKMPTAREHMISVDTFSSAALHALKVQCNVANCTHQCQVREHDSHMLLQHAGVIADLQGALLQTRPTFDSAQMRVVPDNGVRMCDTDWRADDVLFAHRNWDSVVFHSQTASNVAQLVQIKDEHITLFLSLTRQQMATVFEHRSHELVLKHHHQCYKRWEKRIGLSCYVLTRANAKASQSQYRDQVRIWHTMACDMDHGVLGIDNFASPALAILMYCTRSPQHSERLAQIFGFADAQQLRMAMHALAQITFEAKLRMLYSFLSPVHAKLLSARVGVPITQPEPVDESDASSDTSLES